MSTIAGDTGGVNAHRVPPRTIRFSDIPRQALDEGRGTAREIWADLDDDLSLRWQLRVVELQDSLGLLVGPAGTHHFVIGLAGPQVAVRTAGSSRVLRRDEVLAVMNSTVYFERSKLRPPGASTVIVLTFSGTSAAPACIAGPVNPSGDLPGGAQLLVALRGSVTVNGAELGQGAALLLDPRQTYRAGRSTAHVLTIQGPTLREARDGYH
ncbi:hypothetical protein [Cryobacterium sp. CG_9.6]|uniref:hypothetical protein n=1 Tax=Cryobacterium sp. CG_9.6 TaxID=2760710 RepID=UPI002474D0C2|nr:hypothetical protein [Cryobacterium sp. CG_9.6]MDH6237698.1 hypothetical protein [Cryobacterium sp. CG_9.6]